MRNSFNGFVKKLSLTFWCIVAAQTYLTSQSLTHPHIWVSNVDKPKILDNINKYQWAGNMFNQLKTRQDGLKNSHKLNPRTLVSSIPAIPTGNREIHREILNDGVECGILYYLTGNEDYAQVAADILNRYVDIIRVQNASTFLFYDTGRGDDFLISTREHHPRVGIMYDFVQPFLAKSTTKIYNLATSGRIAFNFQNAQKALEVLADNVLLVGGKNSNHSVLELSGALYTTLCMSDDTKRASYFNRIINGDSGQDGINWMLNHFTQDEGMWPEAFGYSKFTHEVFLLCMNVIDRYDPARKIVQNNTRILDGIFIFENFIYPNNQMIAFGDSNRDGGDNSNAFRMEVAISDRLGMATYKKNCLATLKTLYERQGGYSPQIVNQRLEWNNPLELLWGVDVPTTVNAADIPLYTTLATKYAGVVMQRSYVEVNNKDYGLMYYTGGATYVHAHATGIDMELFGAGNIMVPDYGSNTYGAPIHEEYAVSYAAHNTVIVNGTSQRGPKTNGAGTWQNIVDEVVLQGAEPKSLAKPISDKFCFSAQYLDDQWNTCKQLRTNSIIRTSPTTGYYVDFFRSKGNTTNNFHDYVVHGVGDAVTVKANGSNLALTSTPTRYANDIGDVRKQPGWRWYTAAKTSASVTNNVTARFDLSTVGKYLHVSVPGSIGREYSTALAPATRHVENGYDAKETQLFIMRKTGEAWDKPFVALYEPSGNATSTIQSSELLTQGTKVVGVKVVSLVNGIEITDYVLANDADGVTTTLTALNISFKGRFGIVRTEVKSGDTQITLYIGKGDFLTYNGKTINGDIDKKAVLNYNPFPGPAGYMFSVNENQTVPVTTPVDVAYGANGNFVYLTNQRNNVLCNTSKFGSDPAPSTLKRCYIKESKTSYNALPAAIPGTIQAEFYDYGGKNVSFFDLTDENKGAAEANFRTENGMDVGLGNSGMIIGWIGDGEWVEYTVDVKKADLYDLKFVVSNVIAGSKISVNRNGATLITGIDVPITPSETSYVAKLVKVNLPIGVQVLRVNFEKGAFNLDRMEFASSTVTALENSELSDEIEVFPNPSSDGIFKLNKSTNWRVSNLQGSELISGNGTLVDLSAYLSGVYLFTDGSRIIKIIK
jgi:hypothetical protein